jgi:predicted short-subunit dehydrogenase-like oxidoreductase (DUF2520 family)
VALSFIDLLNAQMSKCLQLLSLQKKMIKNIVILGSGNVATHLSGALKNAGFTIVQVFSKTRSHAKELAKSVGCNAIDNIIDLEKEADLYIFAVSDSAIKEILSNMTLRNKFMIHTAGSVSIDIFKSYTDQYGVLYPLQTFTKNKCLNFQEIPLFIESNNVQNEKDLIKVGKALSSTVEIANSEQRKALHLAAVFANNFANHMFYIASELLKNKNLSFDYLKPLINETALKINSLDPSKAQTGPALRKNLEVIKNHIEMLNRNPDWQKIYTFVSENIMKSHDL